MNQKQVIKELAKAADIPDPEMARIMKVLNEFIDNSIITGQTIRIGNLIISGVRKPLRKGILNISKKPYVIPEHNACVVKPTLKLKRLLISMG
jgi:nucleoid DNA-binding protein